MNDTHPKIEAVILDGYRRMTVAEKLERVRDLTRTVQELALTDLRRRYPNDDERARQLRLASRWLDAAILREAFGWEPEVEGR